MKKINSTDLLIVSEQKPGVVLFHNYEALKEKLQQGLAYYSSFTYSEDNFDIAVANRDELKQIKKVLTEKKKEIEQIYTAPYKDVEEKLSELIDMVKVPLDIVDDFVKKAEQEAKRKEIFSYAKLKAEVLGEYADKILQSPSFFNPKWLNTSYKTKQWREDVEVIVMQASCDISTIQSVGGKHKGALMAHYFETLSIAYAKEFLATLQESDVTDELSVALDGGIVGYKVLKIHATEQQMLGLLTQMDLMGLEVEEIEDGMPKSMRELTIPDFDSFVAFDIEHTGTFGIGNGDTEAEIIEIGAVKVVNGVVVDKFDELCNPNRKIVPRVARLTHITDGMLKDKPLVDEIIRKFKDFVGDAVLVGHNIKGCDIPHISRASKRAGIVFDNAYLDTKILAKSLQKKYGWGNIKLTTLSEYFCIEQKEAHRAWCDAEANAYVYLRLKDS